jgi:hypothetical protein
MSGYCTQCGDDVCSCASSRRSADRPHCTLCAGSGKVELINRFGLAEESECPECLRELLTERNERDYDIKMGLHKRCAELRAKLEFVRGTRPNGSAPPPTKKPRYIVIDRCTPALERAKVENAIKVSGKPIRNPTQQGIRLNPTDPPSSPPPDMRQ